VEYAPISAQAVGLSLPEFLKQSIVFEFQELPVLLNKVLTALNK
jgi:hypothetical protein